MYQAANDRYEKMAYVRCGKSGLKLPAISLGLWHNFGDTGVYENMKEILLTAFDNGIVHFDLANNYGPAYGSAEKNFGKILKEELGMYRDELLISTKAGFDMWEGPYGNWGSRKYLLSSLDQGLIMWIFSTITGWIRRLRWKRQWVHLQVQFSQEKHFMWVSQIMMVQHWKRQKQF